MKYHPLLTPTIIASVVIFFLSCGKHNDPTPTPPGNPDSTTNPTHPFTDTILSINLTYPESTGLFGQNYELIISESDGNLLDTVVAFNTPVTLTLKKKQELVNVTTIILNPTYTYYIATNYKAVNPATWTNVTPGTQQNLTYPKAFPSTIDYTNMPANVDINSILFSSLPAQNSYNELIYGTNPISNLLVDYFGRTGSNNYAYLQLPTLGLYSYHEIVTAADTVDISQMDTSVLVHFTKPLQYTLRPPYLIGYPDTTDPTKYLGLYIGIDTLSLADLQYPPQTKVPMQRYVLNASATTTQNEAVTYFSSQAVVPTVLPYPATPIYSIGSARNDSFSISFTQSPTYYETYWKFGNSPYNNTFILIAPADSTKQYPQNVFNGLKSKFLQGLSTSSLSYLGFGYTQVPGTDYTDYFTRQCDPVKATKPFPEVITYNKSN